LEHDGLLLFLTGGQKRKSVDYQTFGGEQEPDIVDRYLSLLDMRKKIESQVTLVTNLKSELSKST
jgi:hypothetical protein